VINQSTAPNLLETQAGSASPYGGAIRVVFCGSGAAGSTWIRFDSGGFSAAVLLDFQFHTHRWMHFDEGGWGENRCTERQFID